MVVKYREMQMMHDVTVTNQTTDHRKCVHKCAYKMIAVSKNILGTSCRMDDQVKKQNIK